ncbi:Smr/MutS family protein [Pararhodobacter sp.]|uniref:Smr/MutS family protein n=1 Tax=Pararhodobacter sp. TaxID=2127056 RepID=UPI002AFF0862|nr:Smr/MutS family protein [Pararhodobacter sp.]
MPRRRLTEEERELWLRVARTATRLQPSPDPRADTRTSPVPDPQAKAPTPAARPVAPLPQSFVRPSATKPIAPRIRVDLAKPVGEHLAQQPVRMDRGLHKTMMRGKLEPEARIDLHGMTVAQAHSALQGFILSAHARGVRLVLVITGKGRTKGRDHVAPMPSRAGVLKHEVPQWLRMAPLSAVVMELRESHRSHGGTGAYYVYLRKRR